jgi:hypothetical protein
LQRVLVVRQVWCERKLHLRCVWSFQVHF